MLIAEASRELILLLKLLLEMRGPFLHALSFSPAPLQLFFFALQVCLKSLLLLLQLGNLLPAMLSRRLKFLTQLRHALMKHINLFLGRLLKLSNIIIARV